MNGSFSLLAKQKTFHITMVKTVMKIKMDTDIYYTLKYI